MAKTVVYIQENGYETQQNLKSRLLKIEDSYATAKDELSSINSEIKAIKDEIHFTKQYLATKNVYGQMLKSKNKKNFRAAHQGDIVAYEKARTYLRNAHPEGHFSSLQSLNQQLSKLQNQQKAIKQNAKYYKDYLAELKIVSR